MNGKSLVHAPNIGHIVGYVPPSFRTIIALKFAHISFPCKEPLSTTIVSFKGNDRVLMYRIN